MSKSWFDIKAIDSETLTIRVYGIIGDFGVSATDFDEAVDQYPSAKNLKLRIHSEGGSVLEGYAIFNNLKRRFGANIETVVDGLAASMASYLFMLGSKRVMPANTWLMVHGPRGGGYGQPDELRTQADLIDQIGAEMLATYSKNSALAGDEISAMLTGGDTWINAQTALEYGFATEIETDEMQVAACLDLSKLTGAPEAVQKFAKITGPNAEVKAEIKNMLAAFTNLPGDFTASLINDPRISVEAAREQLLTELGKDAAPVGGAPHIEVSNMEQSQSFINDARDALLIRGGIGIKDVTTGARDMAKYSIVNIAEQYLKLNGTNTMGFSNDQIIAQAYNIRASHSASDFPNLLENVASKAMRMAYMEEPASHKIWTGETEVRDFKQNSLAQISEAPDLELLPENGEYKHGTIGDSAEKFSILTYGKMFKISRQALINDDLNAFTRLPQAFGQSASRKEADLVYQVLTSNPALSDGVTLFHADHSNIVAVSGALSLTILGQARALMRKQKGPAGLQPLNVVPRFLIVPAALETVAEQLIASLVDPTKSNDTPNLEFIRNLTLVVDSRLDEDSETKCYLAASPGQIDTITRAYLMGEGRPHIETQQGWEVDGTALKCRMDFAAVPVDFRGLVQVDLS